MANQLKYNKGEWSEAYTILKLLSDQKLYAADENLRSVDKVYYPVKRILRTEERSFVYQTGDPVQVLDANTGYPILTIPLSTIQSETRIFYEKIRDGQGSSFAIPEIEDFLKDLRITNLKSRSSEKRDMTLVVHDPLTNSEHTLGFSIKSNIGGLPTLFNVAKATNFIYRIEGPTISDEERNNLNSLADKRIKNLLEALRETGRQLVFHGIVSPTFRANLTLIDSKLPLILSHMLLYYYEGRASRMCDLLEILNQSNPCKYDNREGHPYYEYKIKNYLTDVALGMTSSTVWNGSYDATGGTIIVKDSGEVLIYHIHNRDRFQEYLIQNTKLDTPSRTKYEFGEIYPKLDGCSYLKLNAQIRFL